VKLIGFIGISVIKENRKLANKLQTASDQEAIEALVMTHLGSETYNSLKEFLDANPHFNKSMVLANMLVEEVPEVVNAEIKARETHT